MIGVVIAMDIEADVLLDNMEIENIATVHGKPLYTGSAFGKQLMLCVCGVGKVNAAAGTCAVLEKGADVVLNFGVAGGLHSRTELTEVYRIDRAVQYDFDLVQLNGGKVGTLDGEEDNMLPLHALKIDCPARTLASGDRFNDSAADHDLLLSLGANIRDMEGAAIAQVCKYAGVPCCSVKAISDVYGAGSTTDQYLANRAKALLNLKASLKEIMEAIG